jgi:hypothetical protein
VSSGIVDTKSSSEEASIQSLIDALSVALGRPVLLDDDTLAPLAFSRQWEVDDVRSESILHRGAEPQVRATLPAEGIARATDIVHTAPDPELGMSERVCMPLRRDGRALGYIWLLDSKSDLTTAELDRLRQAAGEIASRLVNDSEGSLADEARLLAGLCSADAKIREAAAADVRGRGLMLENGVLLFLLASRGPAGDDILAAAHRVLRRLSVGHALIGTAPEGAALLASLDDPVLRILAADEPAAWVQAESGSEVFVGQSAPAALRTLDEASRQASIALRVARTHPAKGTGVWATLGADRLVAQIPPAARDDLPDGLAHLLRSNPELFETLAVFLDMAGDIKSSAEALSLHRSGLYYRLRRIEELTGLDLARGDDRLLAHLAVRLQHETLPH